MPRSALFLACTLLLAGCATAGGPSALRASLPPGWTVELAALRPAIDACIDKGDGGVRGVTQAWPMARGLAGVRLLRQDGSRVDCVASDSGDRIMLVQPVAASSQRGDEAAPLYTPPGHQPPEGSCIATVPAVSDARPSGWLSYGTCAPSPAAGTAPPAKRAAPLPPAV